MKNADKLSSLMKPGRAYRRQDLKSATAAIDRDLRTLVANGRARKLAGGLYCLTGMNPFGDAPPEEKELVRAFLKSGDFLLASHNDFDQLGLGPAQPYDSRVVYNHKRSGDFLLGGKRFRFRIVRAYPKSLSTEYLLVDLLNHAGKFPGAASRIIENMRSSPDTPDREKLAACLERYGSLRARNLLRGILGKQEEETTPPEGSGGATAVHDRMTLRVVENEDPRGDLDFWLEKSPMERVAAVEFLREQYYALSGYKSLPRLAHAIQLRSVQE